MNISLKLDDSAWKEFIFKCQYAMGIVDEKFKQAFLLVWPGEADSHFDNEMGFDGSWAPWKSSTRSARIMSELRSLIGKRNAKGRLTSAQRAQGEKRAQNRQAKQYAGGTVLRRGGKLLQDTGRLRDETANEPIFLQVPGGIKVESPTPYSGYLDEGTSKMVARPFMWLGEDAQETLSRIFADSLWGEAGATD